MSVVETPDLSRTIAYYQEVMGLTLVGRDGASTFLACPGDRHSVVLKTGEARCAALALEAASGSDLGEIARELTAKGFSPGRLSDSQPDRPDLLAFDGPEDIRIEIAPEELPRALNLETARKLTAIFKGLGYKYVTLGLEGYRQGSLNEVLTRL